MKGTEIVRKYAEDGFVVIPNVIDQDLVRETQGHVEWLGKKHPDLRPESYHHDLIVDDPFWIRLSTDPRLIDIIEPFIGSNIALFAAHYVSKPARTGRSVGWHQDAASWALEPMEVISIWLAGDDSTPENGCMRVIPGTHKPQRLFEHQSKNNTENASRSEFDEHVDESKAVDVIVPAGGVSLLDPYAIHGSEANTSDKRRIGLTLRYIPTTTRIMWEKFPAYLCRGKAVDVVNYYPSLPKFRPSDHYPFRGCDRAPWV
ncbi:MAG: phytanoyl-CoA dioxygenase family protein [candidate division Zixibacteria bacterium]|nr:phytanoyl-CoA dioxygenase family protein [candidate division Zixibacteria bacterium]